VVSHVAPLSLERAMKWMKFRNGWTVVEMLAATTCSLLMLAALGGFARAQTRPADRPHARLVRVSKR